ncbi:PIN domain-containing protein [Georgenia subflava]|uniref:PIN domain-containing protein n=1 Tax=Georgenia subflava TaxID=1622177 RepID=UPI0038B9A88A
MPDAAGCHGDPHGCATGHRTTHPRGAHEIPHLDVEPHTDFEVAADLDRAVRRTGHTVRSAMDCLIAAVALRHGAVLVRRDRDLRRLASVAPELRCLDTLDDGQT